MRHQGLAAPPDTVPSALACITFSTLALLCGCLGRELALAVADADAGAVALPALAAAAALAALFAAIVALPDAYEQVAPWVFPWAPCPGWFAAAVNGAAFVLACLANAAVSSLCTQCASKLAIVAAVYGFSALLGDADAAAGWGACVAAPAAAPAAAALHAPAASLSADRGALASCLTAVHSAWCGPAGGVGVGGGAGTGDDGGGIGAPASCFPYPVPGRLPAAAAAPGWACAVPHVSRVSHAAAWLAPAAAAWLLLGWVPTLWAAAALARTARGAAARAARAAGRCVAALAGAGGGDGGGCACCSEAPEAPPKAAAPTAAPEHWADVCGRLAALAAGVAFCVCAQRGALRAVAPPGPPSSFSAAAVVPRLVTPRVAVSPNTLAPSLTGAVVFVFLFIVSAARYLESPPAFVSAAVAALRRQLPSRCGGGDLEAGGGAGGDAALSAPGGGGAAEAQVAQEGAAAVAATATGAPLAAAGVAHDAAPATPADAALCGLAKAAGAALCVPLAGGGAAAPRGWHEPPSLLTRAPLPHRVRRAFLFLWATFQIMLFSHPPSACDSGRAW